MALSGSSAVVRPFISVIIPSFNRARLIGRALNSLLAQTFTDAEFIVIDDGSKDSTREVVAEYLALDPRISYVHTPNLGLPGARNLGITHSKGAYITFLDSDDEYLRGHLEARALMLREHPEIELLHGGVEIIGDPFVADKLHPATRIHIRDCVVGGTFFIKRLLLDRLGGFRLIAYGDDSDFFERAEQSGAVIRKIETPTYRYYRTENDSLCAIVEREGLEGIAKFRAQ